MVLHDNVKVKRECATGYSATNTPIKKWLTVCQDLKCDIQSDSSKIYFAVAGQTILTDKCMFFPMADVREKDKVTDLKTGTVYKAGNVNPFALLNHLEVSLKAGVY
jgi:hypothetical protein